MNQRSALAFLIAFSCLSPAWAFSARDVMLKPQDLPASCHMVSGVYPAGVRTSMLYDYKRYSGAMPPLIQKTAQSLNCGGINGSLFYFEYKTTDDRDQAELFAKPILSREENLVSPIEIHEWSNGFVVVSFKSAPADLTAALDKKLASGSTIAVPEVLPSPPSAAAPPVTTLPSVSPPPVSVPSPRIVPVSPPSAPVSEPPTTVDQMALPKPAAPPSAEPPMDAAHSVNAAPAIAPMVVPMPAPAPVVPVPPAPAAVPAMAAPVVVPVVAPPPVVIPPIVSTPPPVVVPPIVVTPKPASPVYRAPPPTPPQGHAVVQSLPDVADSVLANFADKLDCANPDLKEQARMVCSLLDDFKNGEKPALPQTSEEIILGPVYTIDPYGRLVDRHHDVITGVDWPGYASFFSIVSGSGQQDFEIQSLIDAKQGQKSLPVNGTLQTIHQLSAKKRFPVVPTNGHSVVILPGGPRRVYIRKTGNHWVLFGPQGGTFDQQTLANVVLAELY